MSYKILIVEDETDINHLLVKILKEAHYKTLQAFSGTEARRLLEKETPDLVLLDLMLPGISGGELLRYMREKQHSTTPVLVISAKNSLDDKVSFLKNEADDYITKPFEPEEIIARIQASLRRCGKENAAAKCLVHKKLKLYPNSRKVVLGGKEIALTAHEFDILRLLMQHPEKVCSRERLYEVERIFLNLFQNAGRYADSLFEIRVREQTGEVSISFANDTSLLSEKDIHCLFGRFYMKDDSRTQGGTGLGLTVAKSLAEKMNGSLDVKLLKNPVMNMAEKNKVCFELALKSIHH